MLGGRSTAYRLRHYADYELNGGFMEKVKAFFVVLVFASVGGFVGAFLLGLLVHLFYAPFTIETAFFCGVGIALGCGPVNAIFAAIKQTKKQLHIVKKCFEKYGDSLLLATDAEREEVFFEETIKGDRAL